MAWKGLEEGDERKGSTVEQSGESDGRKEEEGEKVGEMRMERWWRGG